MGKANTQRSQSHLKCCSGNEQLQVSRDQLCHPEGSFYPPKGKNRSTDLEKPSHTAFPTFSKGRVSLACSISHGRDCSKGTSQERNRILSNSPTLFQFCNCRKQQSFPVLTLSRNSGRSDATLARSQSVSDTPTPHKLHSVFQGSELESSCRNCTKRAAKRGDYC